MGQIAILSEQLINQIAAGEVVERPASVVKELVENSIDGGSRAVKVILEEGGLGLIWVTDDGVGMSREDAILCLRRHATSKLKDSEGLKAIATKGFRGEALSAIASVSKLTLVSTEPFAAIGTKVEVSGGALLEVSDAPPAPGTSVRVEDLFFNTPARRKFMKRPQTELLHAQQAVLRLALAHPEIGFTLEHQGRAMFISPPGAEPDERIAVALGSDVHSHLIAVDERVLGARVFGTIAAPEFNLPNARGLYTFVNRRYIRDRGINHAIQRAFRDCLPLGRQPVAILLIEIDPLQVDVNVHPQKLEVRFSSPSLVYDAVFAAVKNALRAKLTSSSASPVPGDPVEGAHYAWAVNEFLARAQRDVWGRLSTMPIAGEGPGSMPTQGPLLGPDHRGWPAGHFSRMRYLGTLGGRFLVCEGFGGSLIVLDSHALVERVRLGELRSALDGSRSGQRCLFASQVDLNAPQAIEISPRLDLLTSLGFEVEHFGGTTFAVKAIPRPLLGVDPGALLKELALAWRGADESDLRSSAVQLFACHAARQAGRSWTQDEAQTLLRQMDQVDFAIPCQHGRVILMEVPLLEIERSTAQPMADSNCQRHGQVVRPL